MRKILCFSCAIPFGKQFREFPPCHQGWLYPRSRLSEHNLPPWNWMLLARDRNAANRRRTTGRVTEPMTFVLADVSVDSTKRVGRGARVDNSVGLANVAGVTAWEVVLIDHSIGQSWCLRLKCKQRSHQWLVQALCLCYKKRGEKPAQWQWPAMDIF